MTDVVLTAGLLIVFAGLVPDIFSAARIWREEPQARNWLLLIYGVLIATMLIILLR